MKKRIGIFLVTMSLLLGLSAFSTSAAPEATSTPAQVEQTPAKQEPQTLMTTKINYDGSAITTYTMDVEQEVIDKMPNFVDTITKQVEKSGYSVELLDKDGKKVLVLKKEMKKGEKLNFAPPGQDPEGFEFLTVKGLFSTMYIASAGFDMRGYQQAQELMKFTFEAPIKPTYNNAEVKEKGGLVSTWSIKGGSANPIKYIITVPNMTNIGLLILILAILILIFALVLRRRRLRNNVVVLEPDQYVAEDEEELESDDAVEAEEESAEEIKEVPEEEPSQSSEETDKKDQE